MKKLTCLLLAVLLCLSSFSRDNDEDYNYGNHNGWNNPKNPHYQEEDINVPFDDGAWVLVGGVLVMCLVMGWKQRKQITIN